MHAWRAAPAVPSPRVTPLSLDGRRVRFLLTVLATLMLNLHLFGVHVGHDEGAAAPVSADQSIATHLTLGSVDDPGTSTADQAADAVAENGAHVESAHDDLACGEAAPTRDALPSGVICSVLHVLWELEPLARTYSPPSGPERPHRAPSLVRELGVQRV